MIDTLLTDTIKHGFMFWQENDFEPGECFQQYRVIAEDYDNNVILKNTMIDSMIYMTHYHYQQTYKDIPVEGGFASEHFDINNKLIYTNARFAIDLDISVSPQLSEEIAKQLLINSFPSAYVLSWEDENWEDELKNELDDSTATYEPTGELIIALDSYDNLDFYVPSSRYRLAYTFDVLFLSPDIYLRFYVDANNGIIFREQLLDYHDGIANITNTGNRIIDTRERGWPNNDFVLETNNGDVKIHTKKYSGAPWTTKAEIDKDDEPWDYHEDKATTVHWYTTQTWLFFKNEFGQNGVDKDNGKVRVHVANSNSDGTETKYRHININNSDNLYFDHYDGYSTGDYHDIVAHEYMHGVIKHSLSEGLASSDEPGALNESFADIFGLMAQRYTIYGEVESSSDWLIGFPGSQERSFSNPKMYGSHAFVPGMGGCDLTTGQPDTYLGEYWTDLACGDGDKHAKSGVQNHWFYLLSDGGSGTNDNDDNYNIEGIGERKALAIAFFAILFNTNYELQYNEARMASITAAKNLFGECSNEFHQTVNAWYAVGVGAPSPCDEVLSTETNKFNKSLCNIYPNPILNNQITIEWENQSEFNISIFDLNGNILKSYYSLSNKTILNLPEISKGVYILNINNHTDSINRKIIIQ